MAVDVSRSLGYAVGAVAAATAAAHVANTVIARRASPLPPAIEGEQGAYGWDGGAVAYAYAGEGLPVLLLHSHNAAASSYEMRLAFDRFKDGYRVFAPDLPGYGRSERRRRVYFAHTYIRFLHDFVHDVIGEPAIVIAVSVSAAHAVAACAEDAHAFSHLVLSSPTGLSAASAQAPEATKRAAGITGIPVWGQAAFNALTSRRSIRWFYSNKVYHNPWAVTHGLVDYAWATAHQPNALYAPASFLSGSLWSDVRSAWPDIQRPVMAVWGDDDRFNPYERSAENLETNPGARVAVMPECGSAPHDEKPREFATLVKGFLSETGAPPCA